MTEEAREIFQEIDNPTADTGWTVTTERDDETRFAWAWGTQRRRSGGTAGRSFWHRRPVSEILKREPIDW